MVEGGEKGGGNRKEGVPPLGDDGDAVRRHHVEAVRLLHVEVVHERVKRGLRRERDTFLGKSHLHEGELHFLFGIVIRVFNGRKASRRRRRGRKEGTRRGGRRPLRRTLHGGRDRGPLVRVSHKLRRRRRHINANEAKMKEDE